MNNLFLRHGEVLNPKNLHYANLPGFGLSKVGIYQAKKAGNLINKNFQINKILSSPLLRARQTAEIVNSFTNVEIEISNNLIEWCGPIKWTGRTFKEIQTTSEFKVYKNNPESLMSTRESFMDVFNRVNVLQTEIRNCLFVSHQDTIRSYFFYQLNEKKFNNHKPRHCEIQYLDDKNFKKLCI